MPWIRSSQLMSTKASAINSNDIRQVAIRGSFMYHIHVNRKFIDKNGHRLADSAVTSLKHDDGNDTATKREGP